MLLAAALLLTLQQAPLAPPPPDAAALARAAREAEREYERRTRLYAPLATSSAPRGPCVEHVGRFCLYFDDDDGEDGGGIAAAPPPEHPAVVAARQAAVRRLRRAFGADPGNAAVAAPLIRYLVEDGRAEEAVAAAGALRWASRSEPAWPSLLLGFAQHYAGRDRAAARSFGEALARLPPAERRRLQDVSYLLDGGERRVYGGLDEGERGAYEDRLWRAADPLYLRPGNAAAMEHLARRVWVRLLPEAPWVRGTTTWGRDLEELTMRYGVPVRRERLSGTWIADFQFLDQYDPAQVALVPPDLDTGDPLAAPLPGERSPLDPEHPRSGYTPGGVDRLVELARQVTRFPAPGGVILRADGALALDSTARGVDSMSVGFFLLDRDSLRVLDATRSRIPVAGDTARFVEWSAAPPGRYVYSLEALVDSGALAGRARYEVDVDASSALSDLLLCEPFPRQGKLPVGRDDPLLRPLAPLVVQPRDTLGLYAELSPGPSPAAYRVELSVERLDHGGVARRALGWIGRTLGLGGRGALPRIAWRVAPEPGRPTLPLAVDLDLGGLDEGLYAVRLSVRGGAGAELVRTRPFLVRRADARGG